MMPALILGLSRNTVVLRLQRRSGMTLSSVHRTLEVHSALVSPRVAEHPAVKHRSPSSPRDASTLTVHPAVNR